jgi:hypothetical protein
VKFSVISYSRSTRDYIELDVDTTSTVTRLGLVAFIYECKQNNKPRQQNNKPRQLSDAFPTRKHSRVAFTQTAILSPVTNTTMLIQSLDAHIVPSPRGPSTRATSDIPRFRRPTPRLIRFQRLLPRLQAKPPKIPPNTRH